MAGFEVTPHGRFCTDPRGIAGERLLKEETLFQEVFVASEIPIRTKWKTYWLMRLQKPWRLFPDCSEIRHLSFDSFPVSDNSRSISPSFAALATTLISIWSNMNCENASTSGFVTRGLNSPSRSEMCMFPRISRMRFRFPRFAQGTCSEGIDDNITANLASSKSLVEIRNPGLISASHAKHPELWSGDLSPC
jgi:hypothetical protein